ncbi:MAG: sigma-70 family RNA polymerase sigma factor [Xanthomonadales bacterium]|nr:sigma-70 family RNA polymerase sigma factor [Xanthomonadales bacterium]NIX11571.1 sigma-70 family RNA polymerase sigma factor [Xanthomonadales bacterium]
MAQNGFDIEIDDVTLAGARRGDLPACERIYRKYQQPAFTVAVRICRCREMARDVTQEAFITAFRRFRQYRGDAPFWGWLRRVVVNHAISTLRKQPKAEIIEFEDYRAPVSGDQEGIGLAMDLESALGLLGDEDRAIIWLHDVEGYRHREIAKLFGRTESFSKTRLARARQRLRSLIEPSNDESAVNALA